MATAKSAKNISATFSRRDFLSLSTGIALTAIADIDGDGRPVLEGGAKKKKYLGQFFTEDSCWLQPQVREFIEKSGCEIAYDPFAGSGCLFAPVTNSIASVTLCKGLDIDPTLGWEVNDSLVRIPAVDGAIIITNPPYISNYSASRKRLSCELKKYFDSTEYDDVYLLALDRMLEAQRNVVAIIPETFINSAFKKKRLLKSLTILEENPFKDTDTPVVVVCFDSIDKSFEEVDVYKGATRVCSFGDVEKCRLIPDNSVAMKFNDPSGWLGVRCVDTTDPSDMLRFDFKERIDYDWENGIKVSSRLLTLVAIDVPIELRRRFVNSCNDILSKLRQDSHDIILSPFKGNMKNGVRRRRLDFQTCRAIIEIAYGRTVKRTAKVVQSRLFKEVV